jgi:tetratricopeptide (TPR) repeat protein
MPMSASSGVWKVIREPAGPVIVYAPLEDLLDRQLDHEGFQSSALVVHGESGVGKSTQIRRFQRQANERRTPAPLASGDNTKEPIEILAAWVDELRKDPLVRSPQAHKALERWAGERARVESGGTLPDVWLQRINTLARFGAKALVEPYLPGEQKPDTGPLVTRTVEHLWSHFRGPPDPTGYLTWLFASQCLSAVTKDVGRVALILDSAEKLPTSTRWIGDLVEGFTAKSPLRWLTGSTKRVTLILGDQGIPAWAVSRPGQHQSNNDVTTQLLPRPPDNVLGAFVRAQLSGTGAKHETIRTIAKQADGLPTLAATLAYCCKVAYGADGASGSVRKIEHLLDDGKFALAPLLRKAIVLRFFNADLLARIFPRDARSDLPEDVGKLCEFPFVERLTEPDGKFKLHDRVRLELHTELKRSRRYHTEYLRLHRAAGDYFHELEKQLGEEASRGPQMQRLFHAVCVDERQGVNLFQDVAESFVRHGRFNALGALVNDAKEYELTRFGLGWRDYYAARFAELQERVADAEVGYLRLLSLSGIDAKLRAYVRLDLGQILSKNERLCCPGAREDAKRYLGEGMKTLQRSVRPDAKATVALSPRVWLHVTEGKWDRAFTIMEQHLRQVQEDPYASAFVLNRMREIYSLEGNWIRARDCRQRAEKAIETLGDREYLLARLQALPWAYAWAGDYATAIREAQSSVVHFQDSADVSWQTSLHKDTGLAFGLLGCFKEAIESFIAADGCCRDLKLFESERSSVLSFWACVNLRQGALEEAERHLRESFQLKFAMKDTMGYPEVLCWWGELYELRGKFQRARNVYAGCLRRYGGVGRKYFNHQAMVGLARAELACGRKPDVPELERLSTTAARMGQLDHAAGASLVLGHLSWIDGDLSRVVGHYRQALDHALGHSSGLVDELFDASAYDGSRRVTPHQSILDMCAGHGEQGREVVQLLRTWWPPDQREHALRQRDAQARAGCSPSESVGSGVAARMDHFLSNVG